MYILHREKGKCFDKYYGKLDYVFSGEGAFVFGCSLAGMGIFIFLKTLVSMFGFIRLEELYSAYSLIGYGSISTGLVNLFFGGMETVLLCFMALGIFGEINGVKRGDREKTDKYAKWIKKSLVFLWFLILVMLATSASSAFILYDAYRVIEKFYGSVEYSIRELCINTVIYGLIAFTVQDVFMKMMMNLDDTVYGEHLKRKVMRWEIAVIFVGGLFIAGEMVLSIVDLIELDYGSVRETPEKFAFILVNVLIYASAVVMLIFFVKMLIDYALTVHMSAEREPEEEFYEYEGEFESRVFDNKPVEFGGTEGYKLMFEIPHTEYPKESAGGADE